MDPNLGRNIARGIEAQQSGLLRHESQRRRQLASPRAQVLTYQGGSLYNQGANGAISPTRLITNRGIPEGGGVARKGGGASDASPYSRQVSLASSRGVAGQKRQRNFAIGLEVEFIKASFIEGVGSIANADQIDLIPQDQIEILNPPSGLSNPFKFLIPANLAQSSYSRGNRVMFPTPLVSETASLVTNVPLTPWAGGRFLTLAKLEFDTQVQNTNFELRLASSGNPDFPNSNGGYRIPAGANVVSFLGSQVVGIPDSDFLLPDYRLSQGIAGGFQNSIVAIRIKQADFFEVG